MSPLKLDKFDPRTRRALQQSLVRITTFKDAIERLRRELAVFPERLEESLRKNEFLDGALGRELHEKCLVLIERCEGSLPDWQVPYVLAAIDYFLNRNDGSPDFSALDGFADDEFVINAVLDAFSIDIENLKNSPKRGA